MGPLVSGYRRLALMLIFGFLLQAAASATTYYIDYTAGSDSNNGTSKTTPWQRMPGMTGCSATCAATAPKAGDSFILKGGITWPNAAFPITWKWSGSSSAPIYIGVDQTWYTGGSWTRPNFDAQTTAIGGTYNVFMRINSVSYVTVDNIEMKNFYWDGAGTYGGLNYITASGSQYITLENLYLHAWNHHAAGDGTSSANFMVILGDTNSPYDNGSLLTKSVIDGSDSTNGGDSGAYIYSWPSATYNVIHDISNGILAGGQGEIANNLIYNLHPDFSGVHENALAIETVAATNGVFYVHDNVIHDSYGESLYVGYPPKAFTVYAWNNVVYNLANSNPVHIDDRYGPMTLYFFNNTVVPKSGNQCFLQVGSTASSTVTLGNNHCISDSGLDNFSAPVNVTRTTNVLQSPAVATAQGFTSSQPFVYSSSASTNATVGAGTNLTSSWPPAYSASDTSYACSVAAGNAVTCPARTTEARGTTWDVGAYEFGSSTGGAPTPPSDLSALVQ